MVDSRSASEIYRDMSRIQAHPRNPRVRLVCDTAAIEFRKRRDQQQMHDDLVAQTPRDAEVERTPAVKSWEDPLSDPAQDVRDAMNEAKAKAGHHIEVYTPEQAKWLLTQLEKHTR